ncbi:MAG: hypothetical protein IPL65_18185 [Lewinellaceae bacterium]|nr:hypothetical protein [Lewinellaceae bacterium]
MHQHIHLMGAPGSGVSTLGRALAQDRQMPYFDVDDFYWFTSDPLPFKRKRNPDHRRALLSETLTNQPAWVLGGALCGWGDVFVPQFDLVIYCEASTEVRLERIRQRETARYGASRLAPGGDLHSVYQKFLDWAEAYDTLSGNPRSMELEKKWLAALSCPVHYADTTADVASILQRLP